MPGTMIRLYESEDNYLVLRPAQPSAGDAFVVKNYDLGAPQAKESIEERVGRNGVNDNTTLHGAGKAQIEVQIFDQGVTTRWQNLERLKEFLDPTKRFYIQYQRYGEPEVWSALYRADPWSCVVDKRGSVKLDVSVQVGLPDGCYESQAVEYVLRPAGLAVGFSAPYSAPYSLTPSSGSGTVSIVVGGTRPVPFRALVYGGQTGPVIIDTDYPDRKLSFTANGGLEIPLGSYVELDTEQGTALLNGDPNNSVYRYIDFSISKWWALRPNDVNRISVSATLSDNSAQSIIYVASRKL